MTNNNPYGSSVNIREAERFFGRDKVLDHLYSDITARNCVSIVGTRRIGKSSLLRCMCLPAVQQRFATSYDLDRYLLVYIDLGEFLSRTQEDFFIAVCSQLLQQAKGRLPLEAPQGEYSSDRFSVLLDQVEEQGFHTVLLFDAFHSVTANVHFDHDFFSFLRSQVGHGRVSYVTASITSLDKCCHVYVERSPFFNIFNVYRLGPLDQDDALALLTTPAHTNAHAFSDEEVTQVLSLAGRHPFFIQRVAHFFFQEKIQNSQNGQKARKFKQEAYEDLLPHFKEIWEKSLDVEQRESLRREARWKYASQRKLPELSESSLFRKFVRDICDIKPIDITTELLEGLLKNINNSRYLGESELTHLYLFDLRAQQVVPRSANEKGMVVRRILQEAHSRLRPEGKQNDTDPAWQFYNILNYRFFKGHMHNKPLADLLGISIRQLHRERDLAVEALHETLYAMETAAREESEFEDSNEQP